MKGLKDFRLFMKTISANKEPLIFKGQNFNSPSVKNKNFMGQTGYNDS